MSARDYWYRNTEWNESIAADFAARLLRARQKEQYIRTQAGYLACTYPTVALKLLDQYFQLNDRFDHAAAYVTHAQAFLALGKVSDALASYEAALSRDPAALLLALRSPKRKLRFAKPSSFTLKVFAKMVCRSRQLPAKSNTSMSWPNHSLNRTARRRRLRAVRSRPVSLIR
jgi:tetratricopeptide (TPR) repeat protein